MAIYAKISSGTVVNTQMDLSTDFFDPTYTWVDVTSSTCSDGTAVQIGSTYSGGVFTSHLPSPPTIPAVSNLMGYIPAMVASPTPAVSLLDPLLSSSMFDDFATGVTNVNQNISVLGWRGASVAGGILSDFNAGSIDAGQVNRIGLLGMATGTTSNSTGQTFIDLQTWQTYCGQGSTVMMQWAAQIPSSLSTSSVEYVIEMGLGVYPYASTGSTNGAIIQYKRTTSTNFSAYTSNNGTVTSVTTTDSSDFAVVAGTWYNFMISITSTTVSFYVAPVGGAYVLLGSSTTNIPDITHQCNPVFNIYKASSSTTSREFLLDWAKLDITFNSTR